MSNISAKRGGSVNFVQFIRNQSRCAECLAPKFLSSGSFISRLENSCGSLAWFRPTWNKNKKIPSSTIKISRYSSRALFYRQIKIVTVRVINTPELSKLRSAYPDDALSIWRPWFRFDPRSATRLLRKAPLLCRSRTMRWTCWRNAEPKKWSRPENTKTVNTPTRLHHLLHLRRTWCPVVVSSSSSRRRTSSDYSSSIWPRDLAKFQKILS